MKNWAIKSYKNKFIRQNILHYQNHAIAKNTIIKPFRLFPTLLIISSAFLFLSCLRTADYTSNPHLSEAERLEAGGGSPTGTVAVTGISVTPATMGIVVGSNKQLTAAISPTNASDQTVTWSSSDESVATVQTVDGVTGKVTAVALGTAIITATTTDGNFTATSTINVTAAPIAVTGVSVTPATASVQAGSTTQLTAAIAPTNADNQNVAWTSSKLSVATVDTNTGLVTGVSAGSATITATTSDGNFTATSAITVTAASIAVTGVSISPRKATLRKTIGSTPAQTIQLTANIVPTNADNQNVAWTSSTSAVATVTSTGLVTAGSTAGMTTIKVTTNDGSKIAISEITVADKSPQVMVSVIPASYTIPPSGIKFPISTNPTNPNDNGSAVIKHKFEIAQTEVTYRLWKAVFDWAYEDGGSCKSSGAEVGKYCYKFENKGGQGHDGTVGANPTNGINKRDQPVTRISWRDAIIWCNAYTEWSNATKGTNYTVVYKHSGSVLRDADTAVESQVGTTFDPTSNTATGFRLPTSVEWEFAARLTKTGVSNVVQDGTPTGFTYPISIGTTNYYFTIGNSASGAYGTSKNNTKIMAWYTFNSCKQDHLGNSVMDCTGSHRTHNVGTRTANYLGLYDMSGNVQEWVFDKSGANRKFRGGSYKSNVYNIKLGYVNSGTPDLVGDYLGLRPARTITP